MSVSQVSTYMAVDRFFAEGGEAVVTVRAHAMANSVDPDSAPTGVKAAGTLSRSSDIASAPYVEGERAGPFTVSAGGRFTVRLDEGEGTEQEVVIYNATHTLGTYGAAKDFTAIGAHLYLVINGVLFDLHFQQGAGAGDVPLATAVTLTQFMSAFNAKMAALGFYSNMEAISSGGDWRLNHSDGTLAFSTGVDALTQTELGAVAAPESSIMDLNIGLDSVDLTTDAGVTTSLNLAFNRNDGGGVDAVVINLVAANFVSLSTATALITEVVTAINAQSITTGIRAFTTGSGAARHMFLVVDQFIAGAAPTNTYNDAGSTPNFAQASLNLNIVTTDVGVISKGAPTSLTASAAETLFDLYLDAEAEASVQSGSLMRITHASSGSARSIRILSGGNSFASAFGFAGSLVVGTDNVAGVVALNITGKYEGAVGNAISCTVRQPVGEAPTKFNLEVAVDGAPQFTLEGIEMDAVALAKANSSQNLITLTINVVNTGDLIPDADSSVTLTGGTDGDALTKTWYIGTRDNKRGYFALIDTDDREFPDMLCCVDYPAGASTNATEVQNEGCKFVQREEMKERTMFFTSWEPGLSIEEFITILKANAPMTSGDLVVNPYGALVISNPLIQSNGPTGPDERLIVPSTPLILGRISAGDRSTPGGIHRASAGVQDTRGVIPSALAVEILLGKSRPETADPRNRNRLSTFRAIWCVDQGQVVIDDVLVSGITGNYDSIPARRGHIQLFKNMREALKNIQFRNVDDDTIRSGHTLLDQLCTEMMEAGGFSSRQRSLSFKIDSGAGVNTDVTRAEGRIRYRVYTAPVKPGRFVEVFVSNLD
jgi:hypothetical protein